MSAIVLIAIILTGCGDKGIYIGPKRKRPVTNTQKEEKEPTKEPEPVPAPAPAPTIPPTPPPTIVPTPKAIVKIVDHPVVDREQFVDDLTFGYGWQTMELGQGFRVEGPIGSTIKHMVIAMEPVHAEGETISDRRSGQRFLTSGRLNPVSVRGMELRDEFGVRVVLPHNFISPSSILRVAKKGRQFIWHLFNVPTGIDLFPVIFVDGYQTFGFGYNVFQLKLNLEDGVDANPTEVNVSNGTEESSGGSLEMVDGQGNPLKVEGEKGEKELAFGLVRINMDLGYGFQVMHTQATEAREGDKGVSILRIRVFNTSKYGIEGGLPFFPVGMRFMDLSNPTLLDFSGALIAVGRIKLVGNTTTIVYDTAAKSPVFSISPNGDLGLDVSVDVDSIDFNGSQPPQIYPVIDPDTFRSSVFRVSPTQTVQLPPLRLSFTAPGVGWAPVVVKGVK